jgi:hypothetical protein
MIKKIISFLSLLLIQNISAMHLKNRPNISFPYTPAVFHALTNKYKLLPRRYSEQSKITQKNYSLIELEKKANEYYVIGRDKRTQCRFSLAGATFFGITGWLDVLTLHSSGYCVVALAGLLASGTFSINSGTQSRESLYQSAFYKDLYIKELAKTQKSDSLDKA